jgi:hypothetical protein
LDAATQMMDKRKRFLMATFADIQKISYIYAFILANNNIDSFKIFVWGEN